MLVLLGFGMVAVFMALILTKRMSPVVALVLVPVTFAVVAGAGMDLGDAVKEQVSGFATTAALLFFAIIFFGLMIDVGLFDPLIRGILKICGDDPVRVVIGTALLAGVVSLDGDGSTTFIITVSAMLPIYLRLGMSPVTLTVAANLANGVFNILPWGGPTIRAATALDVSPTELFNPMVPSMVAGFAMVLVLSVFMGLAERRRLAKKGISLTEVREQELAGVGAFVTGGPGGGRRPVARPTGGAGDGTDAEAPDAGARDAGGRDAEPVIAGLDPSRPTLRPKLLWFNAALTVALLVLLGLDLVPLFFVFMVFAAVALLVNFPSPAEQSERIKEHSSSIVAVVSMVFAAAVLVAVLSATGMDTAMASWIVDVVPTSWGPYFATITAVLSMPLTFFLTNDAFYFGVLPILSEAASNYGITPVEMARASIIGQPVHMTSPLVPAMLLLISLAKVDLADHHKKVIWRAALCSMAMLAAALLLGVVPFHA
ncbi:citrate-Mg2+:H+ or citrate-Ca2+:H+ symporter, CitMHS family [Klenkia marina]|uniref:Citrate-Mg2+:H+ or citrate-Ca2+:H+ symporter, CitMHS family n=1 Tax=Klenkia marina TaxID=1960309 RepID=A0A1G4YM98_9ACTN|nr:SLC13 family permease [Klenkia marina]SCX54611.1 citrate-Mg2+:H+ or citrate-Ca2+:H+ symporter, CitMHS family [Klenkia marina]